MTFSGDTADDTGARPDSEISGPQAFVSYHDPPEVREALAEALTIALETAGPDFGDAVRALTAAAAGADPYQMMAAMTFYLGSSKAGVNPEYDRPLGIFQHHLEIAQAVLFHGPGPLQPGTASARVEGLAAAIKDYGHAWMLLQMQKVQQIHNHEARRRQQLLAQLRIRASINRGWGYQSRVDAMLDALLAPLSSLAEELGFAPGDLPVLWRAMRQTVVERMRRHIDALREAREWPVDDIWIEKIARRFGRLEPAPGGGWVAAAQHNDDVRDFYIVNCADLRLADHFRFTLDDLVELWPGGVAPETVRSIVSGWTASRADYEHINIAKLPLDNPVMSRPLIANGDDSWHMFCGWVPLHNPFQLIETALEGHQKALDRYRDRRSGFLEQRVADLLTAALPDATVERSLYSVDPDDGKQYENDVIALISSFAVIAEAKAGSVHPDARHGKPAVLKERVRRLVVDPSQQALRVAAALEVATGEMTFRRRADDSTFVVDAGNVRRTLTLAVTLEPIADMLPRLVEIAGTGLSAETADALSYNINILDLEVVIDLLDHPSEVLHYLGRRAEIEQRVFLNGDEVDLLGLYLETGFNLGEREFEGDLMLDVTGMSDSIDVWHYKTEAGMDAVKPRSHRIDWWERVLTRVEARAMDRWAEIGVTICNVAPPEQHEFEQAMRQLREEVVSGRRPASDLLAFFNGPPQRQDLFVGVIAASPDPEQRREQYSAAIASAIEESGAPRAILLAWTPVPIDEPYFALALHDARDEQG